MNKFQSAPAPLKNVSRLLLQNLVAVVFCLLAASLFSCPDASAQGFNIGTTNGDGAVSCINGVDAATSEQSDNSGALQASLKFFVIGLQVVALVWGAPTVVAGVVNMAGGKQNALNKVIFGAVGIFGASMANGCVGWLVG